MTATASDHPPCQCGAAVLRRTRRTGRLEKLANWNKRRCCSESCSNAERLRGALRGAAICRGSKRPRPPRDEPTVYHETKTAALQIRGVTFHDDPAAARASGDGRIGLRFEDLLTLRELLQPGPARRAAC